jgi:hypothetical protein
MAIPRCLRLVVRSIRKESASQVRVHSPGVNGIQSSSCCLTAPWPKCAHCLAHCLAQVEGLRARTRSVTC